MKVRFHSLYPLPSADLDVQFRRQKSFVWQIKPTHDHDHKPNRSGLSDYIWLAKSMDFIVSDTLSEDKKEEGKKNKGNDKIDRLRLFC